MGRAGPVTMKAILGAAFACALVTLVTALPGCGCTDVGCSSSTSLGITAGAWEDGVYEIALGFDGERLVCSFELPFPPDEFVHCDDGRLDIFLPRAFRNVLQVELRDAVDRLSVVLRRDGVDVLNENVRPNYVSSRPNGPFCAPVCEAAMVALTIE